MSGEWLIRCQILSAIWPWASAPRWWTNNFKSSFVGFCSVAVSNWNASNQYWNSAITNESFEIHYENGRPRSPSLYPYSHGQGQYFGDSFHTVHKVELWVFLFTRPRLESRFCSSHDRGRNLVLPIHAVDVNILMFLFTRPRLESGIYTHG